MEFRMEVIVTPFLSNKKGGRVIASLCINGTFKTVLFPSTIRVEKGKLYKVTLEDRTTFFMVTKAIPTHLFVKKGNRLIIDTRPYVEIKLGKEKITLFHDSKEVASFSVQEDTAFGLTNLANSRFFLPNLSKEANQKLASELIIQYNYEKFPN
jgi:hypothetical protein